MKEKLSSRKLWAAIIGLIVGVGVAFGLDGGVITDVSGAVVAVVSVVSYIITEGKIDADRVKAAAEAAEKAREAIDEA